MAKKTIINDFAGLKGKLDFSENRPVAMPTTHKMPSPPKSMDENTLKVNQHVVLMSSDLRGRIISIGKTVGIELEDGLVIQAAYGEFAVTDEQEISALRDSRMKPKKTSSSLKSKSSLSSSNTLSVDLHIEAIPGSRGVPKGQQLQFQMDTFRKVIRQNLHHRGMEITFIHGIGDGILKAAIRKELDEVFSLRCSYSVGDPAITIVYIR